MLYPKSVQDIGTNVCDCGRYLAGNLIRVPKPLCSCFVPQKYRGTFLTNDHQDRHVSLILGDLDVNAQGLRLN